MTDKSRLPTHIALEIQHNSHVLVGLTAKQWLEQYDDRDETGEFFTWADAAAKQRAVETDEIWTMMWYPETIVGFYEIAAPTLDELLALAKENRFV